MEDKEVKIDKLSKSMLDVDYNPEFFVECKNVLDDPTAMQFPGWEPFPIEKLTMSQDGKKDDDNKFILNQSRVNQKTTKIMIILRYFEYLCVARMDFTYLTEICKGDSRLVDVIDMIKHHLKNKLIREVDKTEQIIDMYCKYVGKIKY